MAQVVIVVQGRSYTIGCEDGEEERARTLGTAFADRAEQLAQETGAVHEGITLLLTGLALTDELDDTRAVLKALDQEADDLRRRLAAQSTELEDARNRAEAHDDAELLHKALAQRDEARKALMLVQQRLERRQAFETSRMEADETVAAAVDKLAARIEAVARSFSAT